MLQHAIHALAFASGPATVSARLRTTPEDFRVSEIPLLEPDGAGEHAWVLVRKRLENTAAVAEQLAKFSGAALRDVSYAGMKDRHAVTEQWFSVQLPGRDDPDWAKMNSATLTILRHARHSRKLRRGALKGNAFRLVLREIGGEPDELNRRLEHIAREGVPNYFGEQRFGRNGANLHTALQLFSNPRKRISRARRGLALSAARSLLFNQLLSRRIAARNWNQAIAGDALQLQGSHSYFIAENIDAQLLARIAGHDVHPTGPLYGRGATTVQLDALQLETEVLADYPEWLAGLEAAGLKQDRRALRVPVEGLEWQWTNADQLELAFSLPAGSYATSVLRELVVNTG
ncbi:MAG: tRNA pseudouridine(13) synthase TruD [Gammaproteobacteria bacterium]